MMAKTRKARRRRSRPVVGARVDAGGTPLDPQAGPYNSIQVQGFIATPKQLKYLFALRDAALEGRPTSDSEMQRLTTISRMTMWTWKQNPAFVAWLSAAMRTEHDHDFELAMARHLRLAIKGSVRSFEALARVRGLAMKSGALNLTEGAATDVDARPQCSVVLLCPRPPALPK